MLLRNFFSFGFPSSTTTSISHISSLAAQTGNTQPQLLIPNQVYTACPGFCLSIANMESLLQYNGCDVDENSDAITLAYWARHEANRRWAIITHTFTDMSVSPV